MVLTAQNEAWQEKYQNLPIRNKKDNYKKYISMKKNEAIKTMIRSLQNISNEQFKAMQRRFLIDLTSLIFL